MSTDTTYPVNSMSGGAIAALSIGGLILAIVFFIAYIQIIGGPAIPGGGCWC